MARSALDIVTLDEMLAQTRIAGTPAASDPMLLRALESNIRAAVSWVETRLGIPLVDVERGVRFADVAPDDLLAFRGFYKGLVNVVNGDGRPVVVTEDHVQYDPAWRCVAVAPPAGGWPDDVVSIRYTSGVDITAATEGIRAAVVVMAKAYYRGTTTFPENHSIYALLRPFQELAPAQDPRPTISLGPDAGRRVVWGADTGIRWGDGATVVFDG